MLTGRWNAEVRESKRRARMRVRLVKRHNIFEGAGKAARGGGAKEAAIVRARSMPTQLHLTRELFLRWLDFEK